MKHITVKNKKEDNVKSDTARRQLATNIEYSNDLESK